ncbi:MAG TPA: hypothetical protein VGI26_01025 [Solirubrobacteraceae bacterium]|jgi:hypothetical protein
MKAAYRSVLGSVVVAIFALGCSGCESTQEKSAALQKVAKHVVLASRGVAVSSESPNVKVLYNSVVRSSEGTTAVVVGVRNTSSHTLENAPIEVSAKDAKGAITYQNTGPGLQPSLTSVALLEPGRDAVWVDDQATGSGVAASATALVGEGKPASKVPTIAVSGTHLSEEAGSETESGSVSNRSSVTQQNLVVYGVARRGAKIVAAGRAVLPEVTAGASAPFQIYFVGSPKGAKVEVSAPPTTF